MRENPTKSIEKHRIRKGLLASTKEFGAAGAFHVPFEGKKFKIIISDGKDWPLGGIAWEHVSISLTDRCPTWHEMDYFKRKFWRDDELVLQFHVPRNNHINNHPFCLHLWKPIGVEIPMPNPLSI